MRLLTILLYFRLACAFIAAEPAAPANKTPVAQQAIVPASDLTLPTSKYSNDLTLLSIKYTNGVELVPGLDDTNIAKRTALILWRAHYRQMPIDKEVASKFLDRYLEMLDPLHLLFFQSDVREFEAYRTTLGDLIVRSGDTTPAIVMFKRFVQRFEQQAVYVNELLQTEKFDFVGDERFSLDRRKEPHPKNLEEAKKLWRDRARYEYLQEKLGKEKEKPEEIVKTITRRYARIWRTLREWESEDVLARYLTALANVYDPHSEYMNKPQSDTFTITMTHSLFGIGALLSSEDGYCKIVELKPGPASESKKLKAGDKIIAVAQGTNEAVDVVDMKLSKVVDMIRGPKGTEVRLTIVPADAPNSSVHKTVALIRDQIKLEDQDAKAKLIELPATDGKSARLGVIDLSSFYGDMKNRTPDRKSTATDVARLLKKLKEEHVDGIILDLRHNGGGSLEEAINLTGLFIKEGPVVQVKGPGDAPPEVDRDNDPAIQYDGPLVVLTSRFSASASEILAGALQDYDRAAIVGDSSTHGKGTVQSLIDLDQIVSPNAGSLKITIRKFYRASGASTQVKGVTPDIVLPSLNNYAEVGEAHLENPLPWDEIASAEYEKANRIQPYLAELRKRSDKRVNSDKDFAYLRGEIDRYKKLIADKTVSLNEEERLKEKRETEAREQARKKELRAHPESKEKIYDLTLRLVDEPGLPPMKMPMNASMTRRPSWTSPWQKRNGFWLI
ncbi:MAG: tail-specific protease [Verrucomicrobia bacterium]|nr:MAG: tail-specific protease [Verrucomicrobiota bacterium]